MIREEILISKLTPSPKAGGFPWGLVLLIAGAALIAYLVTRD